jgi:ABC-2 type transport system ATP-binding protein
MTVLLSSHLLAEVEELCNRVAIVQTGRVVYEGSLADLRATAGLRLRVGTTDDAKAERICRAQPGIEVLTGSASGVVSVRAGREDDVAQLSRALVEAGVLVHELSPQHATLEDLFFRLTEGEDAGSASTPPDLERSVA